MPKHGPPAETDAKGFTVTFVPWRAQRFISLLLLAPLLVSLVPSGALAQPTPTPADQVLEWNQIFTDTLTATNTPNSSSQRLGAIVHTAIFDAYNGIEARYTPIFVGRGASGGASGEAAVVAAAYTALVGLFPAQQSALDLNYAASLETLSNSCSCPERIALGIDWGTEVAQVVLAWRATDEFSATYPAFTGGDAVGQWRPTLPASGPMTAQGLAFASMFVLTSNSQFRPGPPRTLGRLRRRQDPRPKDRIDAHGGPVGARHLLGRQRQRALESGGEPDGAHQPALHVGQ
jgi:hypothetical protein